LLLVFFVGYSIKLVGITDGSLFTILSLPFIDWGVFSSHIVSRAWYITLYIRTKLVFGTTSDQIFFKKIMLIIVVLTSVY